MTSWMNWVYLAFGLGLGLGSRRIAQAFGNKLAKTPLHSSSSVIDTDTQIVLKLQQTQIAYHLVRELSQFKAGFLVRTAHELRSPLNSLIGLHQLILSDLCDNPAEEREFVAQAHQLALKLVKLLDEILDVARIENSSNHLEIQPLQLTAVIEEIAHLTQTVAADRSIKIQVSPADPEIYILADPQWLRLVLLNLVDICIPKMEAGSITISSQTSLDTESVDIFFDVPLPIDTWSEPLDAMQFEQQISTTVAADNHTLSAGCKLLLNQTVLELMQAKLSFLPIARDVDVAQSTRIQVTIPLVIPEAEFLE
ncbi:sensor histidine kinase [Chroogloeocystis siderophila]|uniref:histidine kinase n=1 Tax=Chroogloeocystis siderophila 5.2 s.c.1 TaxID=247279 RepID=A0A1U7HW04_9CHRO|nr:HAMP domain-containing sensor histidine kinase [Chroogloeocystis siderophila]OKH27759.1 hypothetical protein NIES1031_07540 [Chroogloeocystis siderophila 5.2 s.c.1]